MIGGTEEAAAARQYVDGWYCADCSCDAGADQVDMATADTLLADIEGSPETGICCNCDNRFEDQELKWFWVGGMGLPDAVAELVDVIDPRQTDLLDLWR